MVNVPHSQAFFDQMLTVRPAYERLGQCFASLLKIAQCETVYDFGCGIGLQTRAMRDQGLDVIGFDPLCSTPVPGFEFRQMDPIEIRAVPRAAVVCTEVAEHVYESRADDLVNSCARHATRMIIWSAAPPGSEWEGHVNLQPAKWWLDRYDARGWIAEAFATAMLRKTMIDTRAQHCGAPENFHVLVPR